MKIPALLVDQVLQLARQLDEGGGTPFPPSLAPPLAAARGDGELARLRAQNHELLQRLDEVIAERDRLAAELASVRVESPAKLPPTPAPEPSAAEAPRPAPAWLAVARKQLLELPKRVMVLSLLLNHRSYVAERLQEHERRPPGAGASPRAREDWAARQQGSRHRLQDLDRLFASLPRELLQEAQGLRVDWGTRSASGAKRSYNALLERMSQP